MTVPALEAVGLSAGYGGREVLDKVDLALPEGEGTVPGRT